MLNKTKKTLVKDFADILGERKKDKINSYLIDAEACSVYASVGHYTGQPDLDNFRKAYKESSFRHGIRGLLLKGIERGLFEDGEVKKVFDFADYRNRINREDNYDNYYNVLQELKEEAQEYLLNYFTSSSKVPPTA